MNNKQQIAAERLRPGGVLKIVEYYAQKIGKPGLAPHDLRRTYAKLARKGRSEIERIQISLGHASIQTTQRYLGRIRI